MVECGSPHLALLAPCTISLCGDDGDRGHSRIPCVFWAADLDVGARRSAYLLPASGAHLRAGDRHWPHALRCQHRFFPVCLRLLLQSCQSVCMSATSISTQHAQHVSAPVKLNRALASLSACHDACGGCTAAMWWSCWRMSKCCGPPSSPACRAYGIASMTESWRLCELATRWRVGSSRLHTQARRRRCWPGMPQAVALARSGTALYSPRSRLAWGVRPVLSCFMQTLLARHKALCEGDLCGLRFSQVRLQTASMLCSRHTCVALCGNQSAQSWQRPTREYSIAGLSTG